MVHKSVIIDQGTDAVLLMLIIDLPVVDMVPLGDAHELLVEVAVRLGVKALRILLHEILSVLLLPEIEVQVQHESFNSLSKVTLLMKIFPLTYKSLKILHGRYIQ